MPGKAGNWKEVQVILHTTVIIIIIIIIIMHKWLL